LFSKDRTQSAAAKVLKKYTNDHLPEFLDRTLEDVNQVGITGHRPIHIACHRGNLDDVVALAEAGADGNAAGDLGYSPLHVAASRGQYEIAKVLLSKGADVTAKNEFEQTPIDLARLMSQDRILQMLESARKVRS